MLIRAGVVTSDEVQRALAMQAGGSEWRLGRILVREGALDDLTLTRALATQFHTSVVDIRRTPPAANALARLPREAALQLQALPVTVDTNGVTVAVADPPTRELRIALERSVGGPVRLVMCAADELVAALAYWYSDEYEYEVVIDAPLDDSPSAGGERTGREADSTGGFDCRSDDQVIEWLLGEADRLRATAIHLDHCDVGLSIRYRIGPDLTPGPHLPLGTGTAVCDRLRVAASIRGEEGAIAEGQFDVAVMGRPLTCRVASVTTSAGTHIVVRTRAKNRRHHLGEVGVHGKPAQDVRRVLRDGRGVLVVGGADRGARDALCRALVDEIGADERVVVVLRADSELEIPGAICLPLDSTTMAGIHAAAMLSADAIVVDGVNGVESSRSALDASSNTLVILTVVEDEAVCVASTLVEGVGAFLVAGTVRAVLIATSTDDGVSTTVHVVTDDVCQTILDIEEPR
jgi:type IV pilus assembly protein PilB